MVCLAHLRILWATYEQFRLIRAVKVSISGMGVERNLGIACLVGAGLLALISWPGWMAIMAAIICGTLAIAVRVQLLTRGKLEHADWVPWIQWISLVVILLFFPKHQIPHSVWGWTGAGLFSVGITFIGTVLASNFINRKLSERLFPPPAEAEPDSAWAELPSMAPSPIWEAYRKSALPAVGLSIKSPGQRSEAITSRLGGNPDLPPDFGWPTSEGERLSFLAQIRLDEATKANASLNLPGGGLLSFFYLPDSWGDETFERRGSRVYFHSLDVVRPANPQGLSLQLEMHKLESLNYSDETRATIWSLEEAVPKEDRASYRQLLDAITPKEDRHQLLGHPTIIQGNMDCELAAATKAFGLAEGTRWTLLLQLWEESSLEWVWGDSGSLYFWIPTDDLAAGRFDRTWVVLQCA